MIKQEMGNDCLNTPVKHFTSAEISPLSFAAINGDLDSVIDLLKRGATKNLKICGKSALDWAVLYHTIEILGKTIYADEDISPKIIDTLS